MSDDPTTVAPVEPIETAPVTETPSGAAGGIKGFLATRTGRIVMYSAAVGVLVLVMAVVALIFIGVIGGQPEVTTGVAPGSVTPSGSIVATAAGGSATTVEATPAAVPDVGIEEVFVPRDPFRPVYVRSSVNTSEHLELVKDGLLVLHDITYNDDEMQYEAVMEAMGKRYTVAVGDRLGLTQWMVISITKDRVTLLCGDVLMWVGIGQGISTK